MKTPPKHNITVKQANKCYKELIPIPRGWRRLKQNEIVKYGDMIQHRYEDKWVVITFIVGDRVRYGRIIRKIKAIKKS